MKRALMILVAGTIVSGIAAAYAATARQVDGAALYGDAPADGADAADRSVTAR
ncbi:hypothetical protein [Sphingosinithalassobacter sp. CS137]|uniref:hypothetical protein n=1 Tax=Sphingosinithalassobacter sp. CS137 TaxID=2762748 RepID=UPI00165D4C09|nr:hypothetical protein [Sphingosinithalassobacter sp. CS137]